MEGVLIVDYDIHGVVRVRLVKPGKEDSDAFSMRSGASATEPAGEPDIIVRFVDELPNAGMAYLGQNWVGFTKDGFYLLCRHTGKPKACIPFETIGERCEIVSTRGDGIPLLFDIIRLTFLRKGFVPLHASAFVYDGFGVMVLAWAKAGKTGTLLSFMNHGAQFVGDEWVVLSADGEKILAMPKPVEISEWQFKYLSQIPRLSLHRRILFKGIHLLGAIGRRLTSTSLRTSLWLISLMRALPAIERQLKIKVAPHVLFTKSRCLSTATLHKVFMVVRHSETEIHVQDGDLNETVERAVATNEFEMLHLLEYYKAFRFAFPGAKNLFLEELPSVQKGLLESALEGKDIYQISQPYPVPLERLFSKLAPHCRPGAQVEMSFQTSERERS